MVVHRKDISKKNSKTKKCLFSRKNQKNFTKKYPKDRINGGMQER